MGDNPDGRDSCRPVAARGDRNVAFPFVGAMHDAHAALAEDALDALTLERPPEARRRRCELRRSLVHARE